MANTKRRADYIDRNGNMFIPMNVEGGTWNEHFITTPKLICIVLIVLSLFFVITYLQSITAGIGNYVLFLGGWLFASVQVLRFIVFEEKFYYKMYQELKEHEISTPAIFWNIASVKDTEDGAIMTFSDAKIAVLAKIERDTITGKQRDFKETHYDAISDFYKEVATQRYSFVQMNIMEPAGKDPRLNELSKIVYKSDNDNICKLMEMQVGHIKNITNHSLYESDYFLFYTTDLSKVDTIIQDVSECIFKLLDGAYIGYRILDSKDIVDFVKEDNGVTYFNATEASLMMFNRETTNMITPFNITGLLWTDGESQELNSKEINKLRNITSSVIKETKKQGDVSLKDTLYRKNTKNKVGIDFTELGDVTLTKNEHNKRSQNKQPVRSNNINRTVVNLEKQNINTTEDTGNDYIDF